MITAIYMALQRVFWAISFAWIVIACFTKHGGIVNQLLSFKGWIPLSRLTYCAYLLNPIIIRSINLCSEAPIYFQFLPLIFMYLEYVFLSFFCAFVLSLLIEIPCISLIRMFIQYFNVKEYNINKKNL
ncbi:nose resistant to fluoxetine protein 6-like [Pogonomyrmex barbatus]|uniref:Nose resistant to fluoxetine protein 6-like n=1 Tax=Pogonomyrmex barbatus TaxID=144034 RepID=A0A6I9VPP0_9HYME|nr:nose resistant to fluoxetine protein 6-like [Pogonomyrmex barbatus]